MEHSIPFHGLVKFVDAEDIGYDFSFDAMNEKVGTLDLPLEIFKIKSKPES